MDWSKNWLINFNPQKTKAIMFHNNSNVMTHPKVFFGDTQLDFYEHHKHLGITLSSDGKWTKHIDTLN